MSKSNFEISVSVLKHQSLVYAGIAVFSGILLALSFPFPSISQLAWVSLVPLLLVLSRSSFKKSIAYGFLFGFVFFAIVLYWIQIFGYLAWIALSLMLSLWFMLFAVGTSWVLSNFRLMGRLIMVPVLWGLAEYGRTLGPWGFGWANIGSTVENIRLAAIASYIGEIGLGSVIVLSNMLFFELTQYFFKGVNSEEERKDSLSKFLKNTGAIALIMMLLAMAYVSDIPSGKSTNIKNISGNEHISVAIIQPNISQDLKIYKDNNEKIKSVYRNMTTDILGRDSGPKPDLVIWPESVLIAYADEEKAFYDEMIKAVTKEKIGFLLGILSRDDGNAVFNNAVYVDANRNISNYRKIHLVPFGEYMPLRWLMKKLNAMSDLVVDKTPGTEYMVFDFISTSNNKNSSIKPMENKFSSILCFESADSKLVGTMVRKGSRMVFVLTNDGWFGGSAELEQHFRISRMRAIEYGVPVVQVANTGVSGIIDRTGRVITKADINKRLILRGKVSFAKKTSKFAMYGLWLPYVYCLAFAFSIVYYIKKRLRS